MDEAPIIYGLENFQARTLTSQSAESEKINFIVGTQSLRRTNQIQLIEVDEESCEVKKSGFDHPDGEIWSLASAPQTANLVATVYYHTQDHQNDCGAAVFRLPIKESTVDMQNRNLEAEKLCSLVDSQEDNLSKIHSLTWTPEDDRRIVTLVDNRIVLWDICSAGETAEVVSKAHVESKGTSHLGVARWCGHQDASIVGATYGSNIVAWDLRSMSQVWTIDGAHMPIVRNLDFNPNRQYYVATCGDDCAIRIWDIRNPTEAVLSEFNHSHWVWSVRYNNSYDQLLLSCSSDQRIILNNLPSVASQPLSLEETIDEENKESSKKWEESILKTYENHEDSVYVVEWSSADCWTFASLSYDGRLVVSKVPKSFKYKQFM